MSKKDFIKVIKILKSKYPYCRDIKIKKKRKSLKYYPLTWKITHILDLFYYKYVFNSLDFYDEEDKLVFGIVYNPYPEKIDPSYSTLMNRVAVERGDCFDKWSKVPISLPIPETEAQMKYLLDKIEWLLTDEGYKASDGYDYEKWVNDYPMFNSWK